MLLDASAVLAYLQGEPGADRVRATLERGAVISALNWSEVAQKVRQHGNWEVARGLLLSYPLQVVTVTVDDAESAAALWMNGRSLSLADRVCLAVAGRLELRVLSADRAWFSLDGVIPVR